MICSVSSPTRTSSIFCHTLASGTSTSLLFEGILDRNWLSAMVFVPMNPLSFRRVSKRQSVTFSGTGEDSLSGGF